MTVLSHLIPVIISVNESKGGPARVSSQSAYIQKPRLPVHFRLSAPNIRIHQKDNRHPQTPLLLTAQQVSLPQVLQKQIKITAYIR